jgi:hypothetical protein
MDEVIDFMLARIHARNERGPGHRALRRHYGGQGLEVTFGLKPLEMRHLPLVHETLENHRVHAVDTQDDHLACGVRTGGRVPVTARQKSHAETNADGKTSEVITHF